MLSVTMCLSLLAAAVSVGKKTNEAQRSWDRWLLGEQAFDPKDTQSHLGLAVVMGRMGTRSLTSGGLRKSLWRKRLSV